MTRLSNYCAKSALFKIDLYLIFHGAYTSTHVVQRMRDAQLTTKSVNNSISFLFRQFSPYSLFSIMSSSTKKKHVMAEVLDEFELPKETESIVRIVGGKGNNLHMVEDSSSEQFLVSMPRKFRRSVWVKRGDFVVVQPIEEGDKVKAEIVRVLYKEQIKYIKEEGRWPRGFAGKDDDDKKASEQDDLSKAADRLKVGDSESEEDSDSDLFVNTNHRPQTYEESEDETSDEDDVGEESGGEVSEDETPVN